MKRCPACRRDYFDDSLRFCLDDGSALLDGPATAAATLILPANAAEQTLLRDDAQAQAISSSSGVARFYEDPLIGRIKELTEVKSLLADTDVRMVTLTGIGGTGKTRLSIEIAQQIKDDFPDGVFFIELAAVSDPMLVAPAIAHALGVKEMGRSTVLEALKDHLRDRSTLLVLDNLEQVAAAGVPLAQLLRSSAGLKVLATSRELLKLRVETEYQLPPLAHASPSGGESLSALMEFDSVLLFIERARRARPDLQLTEDTVRDISKICCKLDGLPLALELAAARAKVLSASEILAKLENSLALLTGGAKDLPGRQQTMRSAIQWSFDLLCDEEREIFRSLAVFEGGFTFMAAESVIGSSGRTDNILDLVTSLTEKSLLVTERRGTREPRFRMLTVVRDFALETLGNSTDALSINRAHAEYFLSRALEAEPHLRGEGSAKWMNVLKTELNNIRAAIRWALENEPAMAARLVAAVRHFWTIHGHIREGQHWLDEVLNKTPEISSELRWELLTGLGNMTQFRGDFDAALGIYVESLEVSRSSNDQRRIAQSLRGIAAIEYMQSDLASARERINEALEICRSINDDFGSGAALARLGDIAFSEGDMSEARLRSAEALAIFTRLGYAQGIASKLGNLGTAELLDGEIELAAVHMRQCLDTCIEIGDEVNIRLVLEGFAALMFDAGDHRNAARLFGAAEGLGDAIEFVLEPAERRFHDIYYQKLLDVSNADEFAKAHAEGRRMNGTEAVSLALSFDERDLS